MAVLRHDGSDGAESQAENVKARNDMRERSLSTAPGARLAKQTFIVRQFPVRQITAGAAREDADLDTAPALALVEPERVQVRSHSELAGKR